MSKQSDLVGFTQGSVKLTVDANSTEEDVVLIQDSNDVDVASLRINNGAFIVKGKNASQPVQLQTHDGNEDIEVDPDGFIKMETSGVERIRIDSSGNVGIGTSSPSHNLHVSSSGGSALALTAGSTENAQIRFGDSSDDDAGKINYDNSTNHMAFHTNAAERMRIDSGGQIFSGCTSTSGGVPNEDGVVIQGNGNVKFRVASVNNAANQYYSSSGSLVGSITVGSSSTSFNTSSDYRLKENLTPLDGAADRLAQIPVHRFNFIADPDTTVDGFLAHEVQAFVPEAITGEKDGLDADGNPDYQGIDQSKLVPLLTAALQEALQKIDALEARVAALEAV